MLDVVQDERCPIDGVLRNDAEGPNSTSFNPLNPPSM